MCLLHDLAEARVSDLNYVHQKYTERKEENRSGDDGEAEWAYEIACISGKRQNKSLQKASVFLLRINTKRD